jgi:hypothetical protein
MKKPYSFDNAQRDALKGGPEPKPAKIDPDTVDWVTTNMLTHSYEGRAYKAPSGQWSWAIADNGVDIVGGAGYADEGEALEAMYDELAMYTDRA